MGSLPVDTHVLVRQRSALGLKYVELAPGTARARFKPGDTIPLNQSSLPVEFDDLLNTFDARTRQYSRVALSGFHRRNDAIFRLLLERYETDPHARNVFLAWAGR